MTSNKIDIENLLKSIYDNNALIEKEKTEISQKLEHITNIETSLKKELEDVKSKEKELIKNAKIKARNILLEAKEDATEIIKQMNSSSRNKDLENARNSLNAKIKAIHSDTNIPNQDKDTDVSSSLDINNIQPNKPVFVTTLGQDGIILSHISKSNEVQVQIGSLKMSVPIKYLKPSTHSGKNINSSVAVSNLPHVSKSKLVKSEINVIGLNVESAIGIVDKFLDDASLCKLQCVRIVHGKGTGKLRNGIHQFLKKHPHVKSFRLGTFGEGEMGVTVVELK